MLELPFAGGRGRPCCAAAAVAPRRRATSAGGRPTPTGWRSSTTTSSSPRRGWPTSSGTWNSRRPSAACRAGSSCRCRRIVARPTGSGAPPAWRPRGGSLRTWPTARDVLRRVGGFDERFPRAFREDADLALARPRRRLRAGAWASDVPSIRYGPAGWWASLQPTARQRRRRRMDRVHGRDWRRRAEAPLGRRPLHLLTTRTRSDRPVPPGWCAGASSPRWPSAAGRS